MRLEFEHYKDDFNDYDRKFSIDWAYYNDVRVNTARDKRNRYRMRWGFREILDNGSWCYIRIYFGKRCFGLYLDIRRVKTASKEPSPSID